MRLYVNIDHAATVRQARQTDEPDPVRLAVLVEQAGADGITVHLREDRRHIQDRDVELLVATVRTVVNLELAATGEILAIAERLKPHQATLVPERREEITTEGGLDCVKGAGRIRDAVARLKAAGIRTSLFLEPDPAQIEHAHELGADRVELYTGPYANAFGTPGGDEILAAHREAARLARGIGLGVNAGHDLNLKNLPAYVKAVKGLQEVSIGHALISDALYMGLTRSVKAYLKALGAKPAPRPKRKSMRR